MINISCNYQYSIFVYIQLFLQILNFIYLLQIILLVSLEYNYNYVNTFVYNICLFQHPHSPLSNLTYQKPMYVCVYVCVFVLVSVSVCLCLCLCLSSVSTQHDSTYINIVSCLYRGNYIVQVVVQKRLSIQVTQRLVFHPSHCIPLLNIL